jgi:hypothetical protein
MAFLNAQERAKLRDDLKQVGNIHRIRGRMNRIDTQGKIRYFRNNVRVGEWHTRYDLKGLGTVVTIIERNQVSPEQRGDDLRSDFDIMDIVVDPMPENKA